jgi:transcription termination/antitermination protein NusA
MNVDLVALVQQIAKEKGLPIEEVLSAMCDGVRLAYEKQFMRDLGKQQRKRMRPRIAAVLDLDARILKLALEKTVVEQPTNPHLEISVEEARKINPDAKVGDRVRVDLPLHEFTRSAMQLARQRMLERIRELEQQRVYAIYKDKVGTVITGQVIRKDAAGNIYLAIDKGEALLPKREQVPTENLQKGEQVRVYIYEVREPTGSTEPIVLVSRTHKELLRKLLELHVPEIAKGEVEIKALVRDPGYRSKVAVVAKDPTIDAAGACIGQQGKRINAIMQELRNERVDIIPWSEDEADFLIRSLNPARVEAIIMNFDERTATAIVSEDQLSLAIGRQGRNVSLAARLTGWRIDIRTPERLGRVIPPEEPKSPEPAAPQETTAELAPEAIAPSEGDGRSGDCPNCFGSATSKHRRSIIGRDRG